MKKQKLKVETPSAEEVAKLTDTLEDTLRRIGFNLAWVHRDCLVLRTRVNEMRESLKSRSREK